MGELTNALQGKLNSRKSHVKDAPEKQLDLFSSLSDRDAPAPKIVFSKPDAPAARPEPERRAWFSRPAAGPSLRAGGAAGQKPVWPPPVFCPAARESGP